MTNAFDDNDRNELQADEPGLRSLDEILALVDAAACSPEEDQARNVAIVHVLLYTNLGIAGTVALDVNEIDWKRYAFRDANIKDTVPFSDLVAEALERYLAERKGQKLMAEPGLFLGKRGMRLSVWSMEQLVNQLGKTAGVAWAVASWRRLRATRL